MSDSPISRRIIMLLDDSSNCQRAFNWFIKYAYRKNDFIYFAHVMQPKKTSQRDVVVTVENPGAPMQTNCEFSLDYNEVESITAKYKKLAEKAGVTEFATEVIADSSVGEAILRMAADFQANLIVVGSRATGVLRRTGLNDVSRYLVLHSNLPVLVVPSSRRKSSSISA
ncbi:hypothetical protein Aperf_G00000027279 [Anoplocephala perfoliata]